MDTEETDSRKETHEQMQAAFADADKTGFLEDSDNNDSVDGDKTDSQEIYNFSANESLPSSETQETEQYGNEASADFDETGFLEDSVGTDSVDGDTTGSQAAQQMKEELLKYHSTEELIAKLAEANEEIENLRRQVEEQRGMRYYVPNQETDRFTHDNALSGWTQETNNLQDGEGLEYTSYERKISDLNNELYSQQEIINDYEARIEQLTKENNDKSDENCSLVHRILELESPKKQLNEIKIKASEEESLREAEIEKLQKELDSMNESLNLERNIGEDRLKEIQKLEEDIHTHKTREENYQQRLEEASKETENLKRQNKKQCADNGGILHKYLEEEKTAKNYKVSLEKLGQEKGELESQLHYTKEKLAQTERELTVTKEEHKAEKSKLEEAFQGLKDFACPPNNSFQGPGLFVHGTGISGSRKN